MSEQTKKCPECGDAVQPLEQNDSFPFCSTRCKQVDLGRWFDEDHSVPVTPQSTERSWNPPDEDSES